MSDKEAVSRVKIDKMLTDKGWRLFDSDSGRKNVILESTYRGNGKTLFTDYLLLNEYNKPIALIEAKRKDYPLKSAKSQAMEYADKLGIKYFYLSNGDEHYFCDKNDGILEPVESFMSFAELSKLVNKDICDATNLWEEDFDKTILAKIKIPNIESIPEYKNENTRDAFLKTNKVKLLRPYQEAAIKAIQKSAQKGNYRFLLEMATGTGKTLTCAAIIELFLRSKNAHRVLFLVDRIELENNAKDPFNVNFDNGNHYTVSIFKENRDEWRNSQIVITTVQSLLSNDTFKKEFAPSDFDLVIVDEAHRSINGRAREVFEYFIGYKIGLTATPRDYFRGVDSKKLISENIYEYDSRLLRDTYTTFGCSKGVPTYEFSLKDGVAAKILVQPYAIDARTDITYSLLSDGLVIDEKMVASRDDEDADRIFTGKDFEKKLFSEKTNELFCRIFLENAKRDPITNEIGKTLIFCVSQPHAGKIANTLNRLIKEYEPQKYIRYKGTFADQVTSCVKNNSQKTKQFKTEVNELNGISIYFADVIDIEDYKTSNTRICVTVGMMTTGYDCEDLLNICLMRPVLQPSEFIQIKGRGTRIYTFEYDVKKVKKDNFFFFDYFGNFERFENYNYDKKLSAPTDKTGVGNGVGKDGKTKTDHVYLTIPDNTALLVGAEVGSEGMTIDREFSKGTSIREAMLSDAELKKAVENKDWKKVVEIINVKYNNKKDFGYETNESLGKTMNLQRIPSWEELVELFYGIKTHLKTEEELILETVSKCMQVFNVEEVKRKDLRKLIEAYIRSKEIREFINAEQYSNFEFTGIYSLDEFKKLGNNAVIIAKNLHKYIPNELLRSAS